MSVFQAGLTHAETLMLLAVVAGLVVKRRVRIWYAFAILVVAVIVSNSLMMLFPGRFYRWSFWQVKETTHNLIRFAMALELAYRTFRAFPGALVTVRRAVLVILAVTWIAVVAVPVGAERNVSTDTLQFVGELQPRVVNGTVWLFTGVAALILWYRLPVHPFHKAVLLGYVPYLVVFTVLFNALGQLGWQRWSLVTYANQVSYLALVCYWAYAAWRTYPVEVTRPLEKTPVAQTA